MAILQSVTYGGQTFEVPDKFSELTDVEIPANAANGSILTLKNGKWVPTNSVLNTHLTGLNTSQFGSVTAADTVLSAIGKNSASISSNINMLVETTHNGSTFNRRGSVCSLYLYFAATKSLPANTVLCNIAHFPLHREFFYGIISAGDGGMGMFYVENNGNVASNSPLQANAAVRASATYIAAY